MLQWSVKRAVKPFRNYNKAIFLGENPATLPPTRTRSISNSPNKYRNVPNSQHAVLDEKTININEKSESAVGYIKGKHPANNKHIVFGTAFMVGRNFILTAAHNVFLEIGPVEDI